MARIERYCKVTDEMAGDNVFDVTRPSVLSNPFTHVRTGRTLARQVVDTREEAVRRYGEYFDIMVVSDEMFRRAFDCIYDAYKRYDCVYLGCYCRSDEECHADYIMDKVRRRFVKEKLAAIRRERRGDGD